MKEEEPNWFSRWEEELPSPEELTPLSQTLITPDLALAFGIGVGISPPSSHGHVPPTTVPPLYSLDRHQKLPDPLPPSRSHSHSQTPVLEYEPPDLGGGGGGHGGGCGAADDQARTLKRPRLVWTPQLHKRFVDAVAHLGIKNAVPKTIMQLMSVDGLTRENVASHLQKYRLYLKRMQGLSGGAGGGGGGVGGGLNGAAADPATEHLFASGPLPQQFLSRGGTGAADPFGPFVPLHHQQPQPFYHHRQHVGPQLGSSPPPPPSVGGYDHGFLGRQPQPGIHRVVSPAPVGAGPGGVAVSSVSLSPFTKDLDAVSGRRKELSLFPTNDD